MAKQRLDTESAKRFRNLATEAHRRDQETLRLFRPLESQMPFLLSNASERILRGGVRAGKTVTAAATVASAATGIPLTGPDGKPLPFKYPKRGLIVWVVGFDLKHLARLHNYLFEPGAFKGLKIIKDKETGLMRAWRPNDPEDAARVKETKPHQPMIPERFIKEKSYENYGQRIFSVFRLTNGTEIFAFPSGGVAGKGVAVDLIWIDEDIQFASHVDEWQSRLSDTAGRLIWSAWPHTNNRALKLMSERAEKDAKSDNPDVAEFVLPFDKNPFISENEKRKRLKGWAAAGENVLRSRNLGEFLTGDSLVFPNFDIDLHGVPCRQRPDDRLDKVLAKTNYRIPDDWTCYLGIDPGDVHSAVSFVAVPPPEVGDYFIVYDEIYMQRGDARAMAVEIRKKMGQRKFHSFIFDMRMGRQGYVGIGKTIAQQYAEAFEAEDVRSRLTDSGFMTGCDDPGARNMAVRNWMEPRQSGTTKFRIFKDTTPYHQHEFQLYSKRLTRDDILEQVKKVDDHLMDAMAYVAAYDPQYYMPPPEERAKSKAWLAIQRMQSKGRKQTSDSIYLGAGAAPPIPLLY